MRAVIAILVAVAVAAGAVALASGPRSDGGDGGSTLRRYELRSRFVHRTLPQVAALPPGGGQGRPLLVFLHGRGTRGQEANANGAFLRALAAQGTRAPVVVFPNGAEASYWHKRRSGDWTSYVLDEVIPAAVKRFGADADRVAIGGISMGSYGAYEIARTRPRAFCAVGGHSAAVWLRAGDSAPGAFDDAADYARHDVVGLAEERGRRPWRRAKLWLDGGDRDPFLAAGRTFAGALGIRMRVSPGGHEGAYWQRHYRDYLRFYARALARC